MSGWFNDIRRTSKGSKANKSWANSIVLRSGSSIATGSVNVSDGSGTAEPAKITVNITSSQSPYSVPNFANMILSVDSSSGAITINLPEISTVAAGSTLFIKDSLGQSPVNNITVSPSSGTIEGLGSVVLDNAYSGIFIYSDGSRWLSN